MGGPQAHENSLESLAFDAEFELSRARLSTSSNLSLAGIVASWLARGGTMPHKQEAPSVRVWIGGALIAAALIAAAFAAYSYSPTAK